MADIIVSVEDIKEVANSLKKKGADILNAYEQQCSSALNQSTECLKISGLNPEEFFKKLNEIYKNANDRLLNLSNFLINDVANNYDRISSIISNKFNSDLGSEIAGILGITTVPGGNTPSVTPGTPGTPDTNPGGGQGGNDTPSNPGNDGGGNPGGNGSNDKKDDSEDKKGLGGEDKTLTDRVNSGEITPQEAVEIAKKEKEKQLYEMSDAYLTDQVNQGKMTPQEANRIAKEREQLYSNKSLTEQVNNGTLTPQEAVKRATSSEGQAYNENQKVQQEQKHQQYVDKKTAEWQDAYEKANPAQRAEMDKQKQQVLSEQSHSSAGPVNPPVYKPSPKPQSQAPSSSAMGQSRPPESTSTIPSSAAASGNSHVYRPAPTPSPKPAPRPKPQAPSSSAMGQGYKPTPAPTIPSSAAASGSKPKPEWAVGGSKWNQTYQQAQQTNPGMAAAMAEQRRTQH